MKRLSVYTWRDLALPSASLALGLGWLANSLWRDDGEAVFLAAGLVGCGLAVLAWLIRGWLSRPENSGWQGGLLIMVLVAAGLGMANGAAQSAMLLAVLLGLAWWDLADFTRRMDLVAWTDLASQAELAADHLRRLAFALGLGLAFGLAALLVSISLSLEGAMALSALALLLIRVSVQKAVD